MHPAGTDLPLLRAIVTLPPAIAQVERSIRMGGAEERIGLDLHFHLVAIDKDKIQTSVIDVAWRQVCSILDYNLVIFRETRHFIYLDSVHTP
jgi:hypothetical protein